MYTTHTHKIFMIHEMDKNDFTVKYYFVDLKTCQYVVSLKYLNQLNTINGTAILFEINYLILDN